jgi:dTDP-4-amino-4,6-dideoxygalactose transaminase
VVDEGIVGESMIMNIPLTDLRRQYLSIKGELDGAIHGVLLSGKYVLGENVRQFEKELASYLGVNHVIAVGSGTDALELAMKACNVKEGDEVIAPTNTFFAVVGALENCRGTLRLIDSEARTFNMDCGQLEGILGNKTRVLVPTHMYGQAADLDLITDARGSYPCFIIEDAAQALGATYKGRRVGSLGDAACFSFFPTKNLGAFGDAGAVATNDEELAGTVRALHNYGEERQYLHTSVGRNSRLDELQAAILRVKLKHLDEWNEQRRRHAHLYCEYLRPMDEVTTPELARNRTHVFDLFVIRCHRRDKLRSWLEREGVSTGIHYPRPLHLQPACEHLGYRMGDFPIAERYASEILSLPMFPELEDNEISYVCEKIRQFYKEEQQTVRNTVVSG